MRLLTRSRHASWALALVAAAATPMMLLAQLTDTPSAKAIFEDRGSTFDAQAPDTDEPDVETESNEETEHSTGEATGARVRKPTATGLRYRIRLMEDGESYLVPNSRVFRSGEQIQLLLTSNVDAHLAILQIDEDTQMELLYPDSGLGLTENRVRAHKEVVFPGPNHGFRFTDQPGTERLLVVLAQKRHQLEELRLDTRIASVQGSKLLDTAASLEGDKRLQIVEVARSEEATYAVNIGGGYVLQEIRLTHQ